MEKRNAKASIIIWAATILKKLTVYTEIGWSHPCLALSLRLMIRPAYVRDNAKARTVTPSSYEYVRVVLTIEWSRINSKTIAGTEVIMLTAIIAAAKVTGSSKLGSRPEGGGMDGV